MIDKVFFDIDNTLIHTEYEPFPDGIQDKRFTLGGHDYYVVLREGAKEVVEYAQEMVGEGNVYILTAAIRSYTERILRLFDIKIPSENIFTREDVDNQSCTTIYGGRVVYQNPIGKYTNAMIDDLPFELNPNKVAFMNFDKENYLQVRPFYGVNRLDYSFEDTVKEFLKSRIKHVQE